MAHWERVPVPPDFAGSSRAERVGGSYLRYHPDLLVESSQALAPDVLELAADVSTSLARLGGRLRASPLPILYSTSVRSESISSSWIEGIRETPRAIAIAQIEEAVGSHVAGQVVRNVAAMREAIDLLGGGVWEHDHITRIHQDLLPWHQSGYRTAQVWIGGTSVLNADYAAPPSERVHELMDDLIRYANTSGDLPVVQAAIIHAQFETIHPFVDGNGRVGRALVHGLLKRAGLVDGGVIPLSTVLRHDERGYVDCLTSYRYDGASRGPALSAYVGRFLSYVAQATTLADTFVDAATAIHRRWQDAVIGVRRDSSLLRAVDVVVENPVVSAPFLAGSLGISAVTAGKLVQQLTAIGILKPATGKYRRSALHQADEILDLLALGASRGAPAPRPGGRGEGGSEVRLLLRCGRPTITGPCQNRVSSVDEPCWRHRSGAK